MSKYQINNVTINEIRKLLVKMGWILDKTTCGHEKWKKNGTPRPITLQTHVNPIPIHIVKQIIQNMGFDSKEEFVRKLRE